MLEPLPVFPTKPFREMTPQEKADYRAAERAHTDALVKKMHERMLDIIFADKRTVTRAVAERRLQEIRKSRQPIYANL
jgi:hypothetical protein